MVGLVLAGGRGRRMGRPKGGFTLPGGTTLAARAAAQLAPCCSEVLVSLAPGAANPAPAWPAIEDAPPAGRGPLAGIDAAFASRPGAALLVLACDYPRVESPLLAALSHASERFEGDLVLVMDGSGRVHPLVGIWRATAAAAVRAALDRGALRVSDLVERLRSVRLGPRELPGHDLDRALVNWNRPQDLGRGSA